MKTVILSVKQQALLTLLAIIAMVMVPMGASADDPYPNLVVKKIGFVDVSGNRLSSIGIGDEVVFKALVANIGDLDIPNGKKIGVQFRVDGKEYGQGYIYWNGDYMKGLSKKGEVWITASGGGGANNATSPGTYKYSWKGTEAGTHTVTAEVNDDHASNTNAVQNESHYEDNTLTETFYVGYPDLIVTDINWTNQDGDAKDQDSIHIGNTANDFKATLKNNSKVDIPANISVNVTLQIGDILNYTPADYQPSITPIPVEKTVSYTFANGLKAGETAEVSFGDFTRTAVNNDYIAKVSVSGLTGEAETDNNSTSRQFLKVPGWESPYLGKAAGDDIDVIITRVSWMKKTQDGKLEPATELYVDDEICFVAYLKNIGTEAVPAGDGSSTDYLLRYGKSGLRLNIGSEYNNGRWCDEYYSRMEPGQEVRLVCNGGGIDFSDAQIGRYWTVVDGTLVNVIDNDDPNNGIAAEYGNNNNYNFIVRVKSRSIDLVAKNLSWSPAGKTVAEGTQLSKFIATVNNNSVKDLPETENIQLIVTDESNTTIATATLTGGLKQGATTTVPMTLSNDSYTPANGTHTLTLTVATANGETNTENNVYSTTLQVNPNKPDLIITNAGWKIRKDDGTLADAPAALKDNDHLVFFATVKNTGTAPAVPLDNSVIGLSFANGTTTLQWDDQYASSLAAGQEATFISTGGQNGGWEIPGFWSAVNGTVITATIDDRKEIDELDEDNNTYTFTVLTGVQGHYYLVSPELNDNKVDERYRFLPSRNRSTDASIVNAAVSSRLWTLNLKDDFIVSKLNGSTTFHYMIWDADNQKAYRPSTDGQQLGYGTDDTKITVHEESYSCKDGNNNSIDTGNKFMSDTGKGVSYTWLFDNINDNSTIDGNVIMNTNKQSLDMNEDYSVLGNFVYDFTTANQFHSTIDHDNFYKMTRMVFIHGKGRGQQMNETDYPVTQKEDGKFYITLAGTETLVDSVTYRVAVPRPQKGWEKFGMVVTPTAFLGKPWGTINGTHYNDNWDEATLRPQVQRYNDTTTDPGMNSTAVEGGVFHADNSNRVFSTPTTNMDQAFSVLLPIGVNPPTVLFSINATTSTYRMDYSTDDMYIVGTAVSGDNTDVKTSTHGETPETQVTLNMVKLTYDANEHCYKHLDASGAEKPVVFNNQDGNNHFRFAYNGDFAQQWYGQDADPKNLEFDNQYVDYLSLYQSVKSNGPKDATYDEGKDLRFELNQRKDASAQTVPAYVRLYIFFSEGTPRYFYTIRKSYTFVRCKVTTNELEHVSLTSDDYFRLLCERHAIRLPEAVTAYVLTDVVNDKGTLKAVFTELDAKDENNVRYLPAKTPALLIANLPDRTKDQLNVVMRPYVYNPHATYTGNMTNLLTPVLDNTTLNTIGADGTKNYIITNRSASGQKVGMGVYTVLNGQQTGPGYAYLSGANVPTLSAAKAAVVAPYMLLLDLEDESVANDIRQMLSDSRAAQDVWYNLQGQRIHAPQVHGVFIHNGKKIMK